MNNPLKNIAIAAGIFILLYSANYINQNKNFTRSENIFPTDKKNKIVKILIRKGEETIQLEKQDTTWNIVGVDTLIMRQTRIDDFFDKVLEIKSTTIRSQKESNWINYSVDDSTGTHLILMDQTENTIGHYVFGRSKSDWAHNFVRLRGENYNKDVQKNVYETHESIIHHLNTSVIYWGEKPPTKEELMSNEADSLGV